MSVYIAARVERAPLFDYCEVLLLLLPDFLRFVSADGSCDVCGLKPCVLKSSRSRWFRVSQRNRTRDTDFQLYELFSVLFQV